jgi:hypothetical protein
MSHFSELDAQIQQEIADMQNANAAIQSTAFADDKPFDPERFMLVGDA